MTKQEVSVVLGVCSANVQRSPTFEAVINYELSNKKISRIKADSAGINVSNLFLNQMPQRNMVNTLTAALHYGVVRDEMKTVAEHMVKQYDGINNKATGEELAAMKVVYAEVRPIVHGMIVAYRNLALEQAHIQTKFIPGMYHPFAVDEHTELVLPMDKKVFEIISKDVMAGNRNVMLYGKLVGQEPLEDDLKGGLDGAVKQVNYFMDTRTKAVEEMIRLVK